MAEWPSGQVAEWPSGLDGSFAVQKVDDSMRTIDHSLDIRSLSTQQEMGPRWQHYGGKSTRN